jgi:outer membrane protein
MKINILLLVLCMVPVTFFAQSEKRKPLTLEVCINKALENNLGLQVATLAAKTTEVQFKQQKNSLLPNINGRYNLGVTSGRSIDPFTNDFINEQLTFSNVGLSLDAPIFNGFRRINSLKQARFNLKASEMEVETARQTLALNVTLGYLEVLNNKALLTLAETRITTTQRQLDRLTTLFEEESGDPVEYRNLQGQMASDQATIINTENALETSLINLNTLVNPNEPITVMGLDDFDMGASYSYTFDDIYMEALSSFPSIKASELRTKAAKKGISVAKADYTPDIRLFANLNSNYSSAARLFTASGSSLQETSSFVTVNGENLSVFDTQTSFDSASISYTDQLDNNLSTSYGVAMSLPVFNGFQAKNNVALEKIRTQEATVLEAQIKLELKQTIQQAYNTMLADRNRYTVLQDQVTAYKEAFRIVEIRFDEGLSNSIDYVVSKNNLDTAEINLANSKFSYALRIKILEYYRASI